jgi:hypothetical protein
MFMVNIRSSALDPYLLLAQLNSRISRAVWLDRYYDRRRTFPKIKGTYLKRLPVFSFDPVNSEHAAAAVRIVKLAKTILRLREQTTHLDLGISAGGERQVGQLERAIDSEFYQLYELSREAILAIESLTE